jgi:hypothetical protein
VVVVVSQCPATLRHRSHYGQQQLMDDSSSSSDDDDDDDVELIFFSSLEACSFLDTQAQTERTVPIVISHRWSVEEGVSSIGMPLLQQQLFYNLQ